MISIINWANYNIQARLEAIFLRNFDRFAVAPISTEVQAEVLRIFVLELNHGAGNGVEVAVFVLLKG